MVNANIKRRWPIWAAFLLFTTSVVFPRIWFRLGPKESEISGHTPAIQLMDLDRTNLPGYVLSTELVDEEALRILATTNVINRSCRSLPLSSHSSINNLFLATWRAESGLGLAVLQHTPDICWLGAGWEPIDVGQPRQIQLTLPFYMSDAAHLVGDIKTRNMGRQQAVSRMEETTNSVTLPFECRVFRYPASAEKRLVIWCTLIGGRWMPEESLFSDLFKQNHLDSTNPNERMVAPARQLSANYLWQAIKDRIPARGTKQFVRCVVALEGAWKPALDTARSLVSEWIVAKPTL